MQNWRLVSRFLAILALLVVSLPIAVSAQAKPTGELRIAWRLWAPGA